MAGALSVLKKYNESLYPVNGVCLDADVPDQPQDHHISAGQIQAGKMAETDPPAEFVCRNVLDDSSCGTRGLTRADSLFSLFLDGTRQTYLVAEMATTGKKYLPVLGAQISAAVLRRDRDTGAMHAYMHEHRRLMLVPGGGHGMNDDDVRRLAQELEGRGTGIVVGTYRVTSADMDPQKAAIAKANHLMQDLEAQAIERLTNNRLLDQNNMLVVDGSVQFQNIRRENLSWLKYVIGVAKSFKTDLLFLRDGTEIGAVLARSLIHLGDRTAAFRCKIDEIHQYAVWYLRLRERKHLSSPLSGIVKVEKLLAGADERERGIPSDTVNNISVSLIGERYVTPYGNDDRWANHLYPIYLAERLQYSRFLTQPHFLRLF